MGIAYYIVLEPDVAGLDTAMDGKYLGRCLDQLDDLARTLGVRPLSEFVSVDADAFFDDGETDTPVSQVSFTASEGLQTVKALLAALPAAAESARTDLQDCERILTRAAAKGVNWRLEIDI